MSSVARRSCFLFVYVTSVFAGQSQIVKPGEDVILQCHSPRGSSITVLEWFRSHLTGYVFFYRNDRSYEKYQHESFHGRVELKDPEMKNGDVSVILKNININDTGTYECRIIISNREHFNNNITLTVHEPGHREEGVDKEEGDKDVRVGLLVGLLVVALFLSFIGFMIFKKHKNSSYLSPSDK